MSVRYLILGASGFVGARLYSYLGAQNAVATYHSNSEKVPGGVFFDAATMDICESVLNRYDELTHAFVFLGITNIDACARDPSGTARVNVRGVCAVIDGLLDRGIVPIFSSSDAVFDGTRGMLTEDDLVNPVLTYGMQKVEVERYLQSKKGKWIITRFAKVVGSVPGYLDMLAEWMTKLERGEEIRCAYDQVLSPVDVNDVVYGLLRLIEVGLEGVFHISGPRALTRLELLQVVLRESSPYLASNAQVIPCRLNEIDFVEPRPLDCSMSSTKLFRATGFHCKDVETVCREMVLRRYAGKAGNIRVADATLQNKGANR